MTSKQISHLLKPIKVGDFQLRNRIFMGAMTRCRADPITAIPNDLHVEYYSQRASAGLIVTECSQISPLSNAFPGSAGIYSQQQVEGWRKVTKAVQNKGGKIFLQIWHGGRAVHPINVGGKPGLAPSSVKIRTDVFTLQGIKPHEEPKEMSEGEITQTIQEFRVGAENALKAGFDGLELHAANGYLVDTFLRNWTNRRTDKWGGSIENRNRYCLEVIDQLVSVFGPGRVGIKISPVGRYNDMYDSDPLKSFQHLAQELSKKNIAYLQTMECDEGGLPVPSQFESGFKQIPNVATALRPFFKNAVIDNNGYGIISAEEAIANGTADAIFFARAYLANPDLVERIKNGWNLTEPDFSFNYAGGPKGYIDYPIHPEHTEQIKHHQY